MFPARPAVVSSDLSWRVVPRVVRYFYILASFILFFIIKPLLAHVSPLVLQVIVSGKLHAQRAKSMEFNDGYMMSSGQPVSEYIDSAVWHVLLGQVSNFPFLLCHYSFHHL